MLMPEIVTLKMICDELKIEPRDARAKLRANADLMKEHKPRSGWQWVRGSADEKRVREALKG